MCEQPRPRCLLLAPAPRCRSQPHLPAHRFSSGGPTNQLTVLGQERLVGMDARLGARMGARVFAAMRTGSVQRDVFRRAQRGDAIRSVAERSEAIFLRV